MITIQGLTTIITGTGTTGDTTILGDGTTTGIFTHTNLIIVGIIFLGLIAHLLDRELNRRQSYLDLESHQELYQNPEKIEQE